MTVLEMASIEEAKIELEEILKPYQQELNQGQKKAEFVKKCIQCVEKNDFFQLDELLKSKQAAAVLEEDHFSECVSIFSQLQAYADQQIENYRLQFKDGLQAAAENAGLSITLDVSKFTVMKGIEGTIDFANRKTVINQVTIKSIDPKRIVAAALNIKRKLYDSPFDPQTFINSLFDCYQEILQKANQGVGNSVSILQFYTEYVWSLQSKTFFQNMDKGKFKGYSLEQFAIDMWRYFSSKVACTEDGYGLRLNPGRNKSLWLIDQNGESRQITHISFVKI